ncbi:ABC transporter permease [Achromobacter animicus]|uniref:ABC transporter permease n=1 Tax=Achromobacter animicus TaxID=1389935 RepID=UPI001465C562|nr:ABC transporter permease [Achromobacter animicus]CAB3823221.1 hypothetical protein LMG26691_00595 [Achromobacter animicus]
MIKLDFFKGRSLILLMIVMPMAVALIYFSFFSLDRYVSTAQVAVRQVGNNDAPAVPGLAIMLSGLNPTSREETLYLREYLSSQDMLNVLERQLDWSKHYAAQMRDPLYWLEEDAPQEDKLEYFRRVVRTHFDEQTGLLGVTVQAFDPKFANDTLKIMLGESERFVNELSHRMAREQMAFAQSELAKAREMYEQRREAMLEFQGRNSVLDAEATAKARGDIIVELEGDLTKERTTLKNLQSRLANDTPQIRQQRNRIRALEQQLESETRRLVSQNTGSQFNVVASRYRSLTIDAAIAEEAYKFAVSSVESARIEASKKLRSLIMVVSPNMAESPSYPERLYDLLTIFIGLMLLYAIVRFAVATIEDHRD